VIATGSRAAPAEYNLLQVFRAICGRIPGAYIESVKTADDAARKRAASMLKAGLIDEPGLTVQDVAEVERRKVEGWGGIVLSIRLRGSAEGLIAFVGPRQVMIRGDGVVVVDAVIAGIAEDLRAAGFSEITLQR
jgi:hypothetical protein